MMALNIQLFAFVVKELAIVQKTLALICFIEKVADIAKYITHTLCVMFQSIKGLTENGAANVLVAKLNKRTLEKTMQNKVNCLIGNVKVVLQKQKDTLKIDQLVMLIDCITSFVKVLIADKYRGKSHLMILWNVFLVNANLRAGKLA